MQKRFWKVTLVGTLCTMLIIGVSHCIRAGSYVPCGFSFPNGAKACGGCWVVETSEGASSGLIPITLSLQARCANPTFDGICMHTWSSAIPSPGCYEETTSCGSDTRYYICIGTIPGTDPECGVTALPEGLTTPADVYYFQLAFTNATAWNGVGVFSCNKSYLSIIDQWSQANCQAP